MPLGQTVWSPTALLNAILKLGTYLAKDGLVVWIHAPCMFPFHRPHCWMIVAVLHQHRRVAVVVKATTGCLSNERR